MAKKPEAEVKESNNQFQIDDANIAVTLVTGSEKVLASFSMMYHGMELHGGHIIQGQRGNYVTFGQRYEQDSYKTMWSPTDYEDRKALQEKVMDTYNQVLTIMQNRTRSMTEQELPSQEMTQGM